MQLIFATLTLLLLAIPAHAAENGAALPAQTLAPVGGGGGTLGLESAAESQKQPVLGQSNRNTPAKDSQKSIDEALRSLLPLGGAEIKAYKDRVNERDKALSPDPPVLHTRTVMVALEAGSQPITVRTTGNAATSLVFHDFTGQAWPISSVTNGGERFFNLLRPEVPSANLINVVPLMDNGSTSIVLTFQGKDVPLVIRLVCDSLMDKKRSADGMVLFQIRSPGPNAQIPVIAAIKDTESINKRMLQYLLSPR
jgi:intracellular multiplication protein IcmK